MDVCSCQCVGTCSLSAISNAVISGEWQSCLPMASCHPKHATSSTTPTWKAKAGPRGCEAWEGGAYGAVAWRLRLIFVNQVSGIYLREYGVHLGPVRPGLKERRRWRRRRKKKPICWIICMTPQRHEILKNLAINSAPCLLQGGGRKPEVLLFFASSCPVRCTLWGEGCVGGDKEVWIPGCLPGHLQSWHTPAASMPPALMRYRSGRHNRNRLAKGNTLFSPRGSFLYTVTCHAQQTSKGVMEKKKKKRKKEEVLWQVSAAVGQTVGDLVCFILPLSSVNFNN